MSNLEIGLLGGMGFLLLLYIISKIKNRGSIKETAKEIKEDVKETISAISSVIPESTLKNVVKEFMLLVEKKSSLNKMTNQPAISSMAKKAEVIEKTKNWQEAISEEKINEEKVTEIIEEYIDFANKMQQKN